jgi:hypothetical protein
MSRIILSKYDDGQPKLVVGWDHPAHGAFWQEFNREPADGNYPDDWEEVIRYGGMWPGLPLANLKKDMPEELQELVTDEVMAQLYRDARDPDSGTKATLTMIKK